MDLRLGDCRDVLATLDPASIDAVVTDPPYGLSFMGKEWDNGDVAHSPAFWRAALRVTKPGGYLLAFGGTRTYHRMACAIEDAGWQIRDMITWHYATGFPKAKDALKPASEPIVVARAPGARGMLQIDACRIEHDGRGVWGNHGQNPANHTTEPGSNGTTLGTGWHTPGSHRNPAGRWPANVVFSHSPLCQPRGTTRVKGTNLQGKAALDGTAPSEKTAGIYGRMPRVPLVTHTDTDGMETVEAWECHESCPVGELDRQSGVSKSTCDMRGVQGRHDAGDQSNQRLKPYSNSMRGHADTGTASRFFYVAKPSQAERSAGLSERNSHPCVKPLQLCRYLCRLVTPPGGTVLDPFTGSGTTGMAAVAEGFGFIGIEQSAEYLRIAERRIASVAPTLFTEAI